MIHPQSTSTLFPYTTLFRSSNLHRLRSLGDRYLSRLVSRAHPLHGRVLPHFWQLLLYLPLLARMHAEERVSTHSLDPVYSMLRSEEHTSELQSRQYLVCRLL